MAWSIYRRVRRSIGRQKLRPVRSIISIVILSLISMLFLALSFQQPKLLFGIIGGLMLGALLGFIGLRLTKFETTAEGHSYTPNTHIGIALSVLFAGRIAYRLIVLGDAATAANHPPAFQSALTFFILGLTVGYYMVYQAGLLVHKRDKNISSQNSVAGNNSSLDSASDRP